MGASIVEASGRIASRAIAGRPRISTPLPGRTVRGSTQGRPIMAALDLLGRRWALRVLWELRDGPLGFRALQAACDGMSSSVLRDRLHELTEAVLVERRDDAYQLTTLGADLGNSLAPLTRWADRWSEQLR
jgi:DNA-binding HxlR family transcriptional regulator